MIYCFDLDGTLCSTRTDGAYQRAEPYRERIAKVNRLHADGHTIIINTARGSVTGESWLLRTREQLDAWGVQYHQLIVGVKPFAHAYVDDRAVNAVEFFRVQ